MSQATEPEKIPPQLPNFHHKIHFEADPESVFNSFEVSVIDPQTGTQSEPVKMSRLADPAQVLGALAGKIPEGATNPALGSIKLGADGCFTLCICIGVPDDICHSTNPPPWCSGSLSVFGMIQIAVKLKKDA